ncbi:hypothetical protein ACFL3V_03345 [Nanoarchaeota archaeon]
MAGEAESSDSTKECPVCSSDVELNAEYCPECGNDFSEGGCGY